jgi:hypothetical protein
MTDTLRTKHNELKEVTERASEELARAKLTRRVADQDLMQALKSERNAAHCQFHMGSRRHWKVLGSILSSDTRALQHVCA